VITIGSHRATGHLFLGNYDWKNIWEPYLKPGMNVLDCGCGPGAISIGLAEAVFETASTQRRYKLEVLWQLADTPTRDWQFNGGSDYDRGNRYKIIFVQIFYASVPSHI
jgi:hypothetical protein